MGIEKTKLMECKSIYWTDINDDIEKHIKLFYISWFQQTQPKERIIHHKIPAKPWEIVGADVYTLHNGNYLCIVDYQSKFPVFKKTEDIWANSLILICKIIFWEYHLPKKIISDSGVNFISDKFKTFCISHNIEQAFFSSYHHQSNGHVEACIKLIKHTQRGFNTKSDPHMAWLQIRLTPLGPGLPKLATLLFKHPIRGIMAAINRPLIGVNNNNEHYKALVKRQTKMIRTMILWEIMLLFQ